MLNNHFFFLDEKFSLKYVYNLLLYNFFFFFNTIYISNLYIYIYLLL